MRDIYPYRHRGTGMHEGTTFIYFVDHTVISYPTENPQSYFAEYRDHDYRTIETANYVMTPADFERLESIPTRAQRNAESLAIAEAQGLTGL